MKSSYKIVLIVVAVLFAGVIAYEVFISGGEESASTPTAATAPTKTADASAAARTDRDNLPALPAPKPSPAKTNTTPASTTNTAATTTGNNNTDTAAARPRSSNLFDQVRQRMDQGQIPPTAASPSPSASPSSTPSTSPSASSSPALAAAPAPAPSSASNPAANAAMDASGEPGRPLAPTTITFGGDQPIAAQLPDSTAAINPPSPAASAATPPPVLPAPKAVSFGSGSPGPSSPSTFAPRPTTPTTPAAPTPPPPTPARTYTIASGDTFTNIAAKLYGSERFWVDIAQANPTVDPNKLKIGQEIKLPASEDIAAAQSPAAATDAARSTTPAPPGTRSYTIHAGDTLSSIAQRFYGNPDLWRTLYDANRAAIGPNPDRLSAGETLTIPDKPQ
jgi:nucleoid-associated protein YgaU